MNLAYLGDPLDHWKGALFESLQKGGVLKEFAVDPMASDLESWKPEDFTLLARLLKVRPDQIITHDSNLQDRTSYFAEISHHGDLFLDPDTGVATWQVTGVKVRQFVRPSEIKQLLDSQFHRLVMFYQHVRAQKVRDRVDAVLGALRHEAGEYSWCSYECPTVAMLFLARTPDRPASVRKHFANLLGRHATGRIRGSEL